ncbi:hypothetical protein NHH03_21380 [Stieleria sp. TO1_6]|uniref:hypothetical protein n=1 Tax=Stieleria tagensis TaxID=2956795 RepID=UPI00209BB7A7|nr:hypothetical protein [Stieleria tagensis]MCO8124307.1 hypothetical protein [Stieleria tagensis]
MSGTAPQPSLPSRPPAPSRRRPKFQISLALMLLLMVVFAFISAALVYAARVPAIRQEINVLVYGQPDEVGDDIGRVAHRAFIMFTFTSPLLLACVLSTALAVMNFFQRDRV